MILQQDLLLHCLIHSSSFCGSTGWKGARDVTKRLLDSGIPERTSYCEGLSRIEKL